MFTNNHKIAVLQFALAGILFSQMFSVIPNSLMSGTKYIEGTGIAFAGLANSSSDSFVAQGEDEAPTVISITRRDPSPNESPNVQFFVRFSESVTGVNASDFRLRITGLTGASIEFVVGIDDLYSVGVKTGTGVGTLRLDLKDDNSIIDLSGKRLGGPALGDGNFSAGEVYSITRAITKPGIPVLVSPAKGTMVNLLQPVFDWKNSSPAAHHYQIQVAENNTFSTVVIDETDILESTFTPSADLTPGIRYYWRVRAFNMSNVATAWSAVWNLRTPLTKPVLVSPSQAESLLTDRPTFTWDTVPGAAQYQLQVSALSNFSTLLWNATTTTSDFMPTKDLPQRKTLYWRVRAKTPIVTSPWSTKWTFTTGNPPSVPVLAVPANNALVKDYTPGLDWKDSTGPSVQHYEIEVDNDIDFSSLEITSIQPVSEFTPGSDLASNTRYYWRARALSTAGHTSGWSVVWSFRTVISAPQSLTMIPTGDPLRPSFDWDDAIGPFSGYTIQISTSSTFSTLLVNSTTMESMYVMAKNLPAGKTLYWKVRVNGANGPSAWATSQFTMP